MSYTNVYPSRINWENEPSIASPINATNLNKIDYAVYEHDQTFETWDVTKANQSDLLLSVKSIDYDTTTGVFVFTWQNGTTKTVDLNIEKIPVSFSMSPQGVITMTTEDGTQYTADVGSLIKTYTFTDSTEIDFTVTTDQSGNKTVTAALKDGSIVGTKLEPNYLANCQSAANSASGSATAADGSAEDSEAWAVGTRDGVPVPSTDPAYNNNAKYWAEHTTSSFAGLTDTDITNPQDGQVPVYNSSTNKWENADQSAGGGSTIKVTTSESSLYGRTVTITCGTYTESGTFSNSGEAEFTGVTATGTFTITTSTSGGTTVTKSLSVPYFGNYSTTITLFSATITATFPADRGATCTCDGVTATTSPYTFTVGSAGTYPVQATLDGASKSVSVNITTDGQSESCNFAYGTINLTFSNEFRGLTITCGLNGTTITKQAPSSGNTMAFYPPTTGTWTISGTYSGVTYTTTATVSSLSTPVSAILQTIPDGSTITPTDSIQTWLKCAAINDKNYTTLAEVLDDTDTFTALLQDSNACDYMARSTTWSTTICADADAMARIGKYDYCSCALLGNSTWNSAILASSYADSVALSLVPKMTSDTAPSGTVSASGVMTSANDFSAWKAFDGVTGSSTDKWVANTTTNAWIAYEFPIAVVVNKVWLIADVSGSHSCAKNVSIDAYDGSSWVTLKTATLTDHSSATDDYLTFDNDTAYTKYRVFVSDMYVTSSGTCIALRNVQFYGHTNQTNIIHSAASDTVYYIDGSNQTIGTTDTSGVGSVTWANLPVGTMTVYSTVASNPDDLTAAYSQSIRITPHTTEVWVVPDNALYWYGYMSDKFEDCTSANGWSRSSYSASAPTHETNYIDCAISGTYKFSMVGTKDTLPSGTVLNAVCQGVTVSGGEAGYIAVYPSKTMSSTSNYTIISTTTLMNKSYTMPAGGYASFGCNVSSSSATRKIRLYAFLYE